MAVLLGLGVLVVLVLALAWWSDRRDAQGGTDRVRPPRAIGAAARAARKQARHRRRGLP